ncbi:hypothetical protein [Pseudoalteromonas agarivorans]|uniref:hypothetical protein n=1 Tax=Pseudoalteromonas agarivorans TaxID=176102 RepID=UPI00249C4D04|nr:hypothetical protein [Pseudoalteromonas agarivorans]MDI3244590.1 hypothetical protein [Pseudoalteromonas agarivorans]
MGIELLENKGFAFLNIESINQEKRQIVVIGTARGGTSLVAGSLHHLGIFTGEKSNPPVFEDVLLSEAFEQDDIPLAKSIAEKYTEEHDIWAWKRPAALNYLDKIEEAIPNPFFIFIFKDIFAIANRNSISMQADISKGLSNALTDYAKIVEFASKTKRPVMLVSAEKALQNKESFVGALIEMNKDIDDKSINKEKAIDFITPNPPAYLDATRITKSLGKVGLASHDLIQGWAVLQHDPAKVAEVEVYVDGKLHISLGAKEFREGPKAHGLHPTGYCGFTIAVDSKIANFQSEIKIIVKGDVMPLENGIIEALDGSLDKKKL